MKTLQTTTIWQRTLDSKDEASQQDQRARLRASFENFRDRAKTLAQEIALSLPEFTVHDVTHLDALWEMADLIAGPEFSLTPAEAFVLGGAFLVHDLGMGLAAYPEGLAELRNTPLWHDTVISLLKRKLGRSPNKKELEALDPNVTDVATRTVLRELHARHAERLALISWKPAGSGSQEFFLIEDAQLRATYGPIIGKIAHSHWWSVEELAQRLPVQLGAPGWLHNSWTVDPIRVACLLRVADASHLDERRAPAFLRALRKPSGISAAHWTFQEKLYQPRLESDRLVYTSKDAFPRDQATAWWTCYETLQMVDRELRQVDSLLADTKRQRLAARGVSHTEDPDRLSKVIGTAGWEPVDAQVRVGNVARLVSSLGGKNLYGRDRTAPLRELIQNACDAVRARRLLENRPSDWGEVVIREGRTEDGQFWIEVEDSGIGMSQAILTGPFLDFGTSFWGSGLMHRELPGLEAKGFSSTGTFGIGFFSVFMWGDSVSVTTRRAELGREQTLVLEFAGGLSERPILRAADAHEQMRDGGTRIRVTMRDSTGRTSLADGGKSPASWGLVDRCRWVCPAVDVNLYVETKGKRVLASRAGDWITMRPADFTKRLLDPRSRRDKGLTDEVIKKVEQRLELIKSESGEILGRACMLERRTFKSGMKPGNFHASGVVSIGGFRSSSLSGIFGVLLGEPQTAARSTGMPVASGLVVRQWASEQAIRVDSSQSDLVQRMDVAAVVRVCGGNTGNLEIAEGSGNRWLSAPAITALDWPDEVLLVHNAGVSIERDRKGKLDLYENVLSVAFGSPGTIDRVEGNGWCEWPADNSHSELRGTAWGFHSRTLVGSCIEALAASWKAPLNAVLRLSEHSTDDNPIRRHVGTREGKPVTLTVDVIRRPKA